MASNFDLKKKEKYKVTDANQTLKRIMKKMLLIILIAGVPIFFVILLIAAVILAVWHDIFGASAASSVAINHYFQFSHVSNGQLMYGGFMHDVAEAMEKILWMIFIKPIIWLLNQVTNVVYFIGSGGVNKQVFTAKSITLSNFPSTYKMFFIALGVSIGLMAVLLGVKLMMIMGERFDQKGIAVRRTFQNVIFVVVSVLLMPFVFYMINNLTDIITAYINKGTSHNYNLGLRIFNASFNNGEHHFTYIPDAWKFTDSGKFNYIICLFAECFMIYVMVLIALNLFIRIFELFFLFCVSPLVVASTVADVDGNLKHFKNWSEITLQKFILFSFIFLAFNIFITSISIFTKVAVLIKSQETRPIFVLLGIFGASIVCIKAPQILNSIVGGQASLMDSLSHLSGLKTASSAVVTGGMGYAAGRMAKKGMFGFSKKNALGGLKKVGQFKKGAVGFAKGSKATIAGATAGIAFGAGVSSSPLHNVKRAANATKQGITKGVNKGKDKLKNLGNRMGDHWIKYYKKGREKD